MKLVYEKTGLPVVVGDQIVTSLRQLKGMIVRIIPPHKPSSTGRVVVMDADGWEHEFFPGVVDAHWIDREDRREDSE